MRNALDRIPDYGERTGADGEPIDEFATVLAQLPAGDNPDLIMLASAITRHRCDGRGDIVRALKNWTPEGEPH